MRHAVYYDLYDGGELYGKYRAEEIAEIIGCCTQTVYNLLRTGRTYNDQWRVEPGAPPDFYRTWTAACEAAKERLDFDKTVNNHRRIVNHMHRRVRNTCGKAF